jgi:hypothetical protein
MAFLFVYFSFSDSYQKSLEARINYFLGNYRGAYDLAENAYENEKYNRMAFTIMKQSEVSISFMDYIQDGKDYLRKIEYILDNSESINKVDRIKMKMMSEIMIEIYEILNRTVLTDKKLVAESKDIYVNFKELHRKLE